MGEVLDAVRALGRRGARRRRAGPPPGRGRSAAPWPGGEVAVRGDVSSQFLSGLLLAGPAMRTGLVARLVGDLVSQPYVDMTVAVMAHFGVDGRAPGRPHLGAWRRRRTAATDLAIEPDASAASYVFAAAALLGGRVTVDRARRRLAAGRPGLRRRARADGRDGRARRRRRTTVTGTGRAARRRGRHEPALRHRPDPRGGGRLRRRPDPRHRASASSAGKETDRVGERGRRAAPARASTPTRSRTASPSTPGRCAPPPCRPTTTTAWRWRSRSPACASDGVQIADPGCVAKTFPGYWRLLDELRAPSQARRYGPARHEGHRHRRAGGLGEVDGGQGAGGAARARVPRHRRHVPVGHLRGPAPRRRPGGGRAGRAHRGATSSSRSAPTASPSTASTPRSRSAGPR